MSVAKRTGPVALTTTLTTNIMQGGGGDATKYDRIRRIHVANKTNVPVTFSLWLGASGGNTAGTELYIAKSVAANDVVDVYCDQVLKSTEYIVGGASAPTSLTIMIESVQDLATP